jgi:cytochrome c6
MKKLAQNGALFAAALMCLIHLLSGASPAGRVSGRQNRDEPGAQTTAASVLFAKNCATCHGKDGRAKTFKAKFNGARNLTDAQWQESVSDERLFNSITNGRGKMPSFKKKFSSAEIESLVAHVRGLRK